MNHTPGKWEALQVGDTGGENPVDVYEVVADGRKRVAEYVTDADARLIAAAPDLLEAARKIVAYADSEPDGGDTVEIHRANIERARTAIKKARAA